ncbi:MAG: aminopeptidase P family protein [Proteobacteria bacterium]|nr:aminopeptidase P family protein [Pseudomonadota bacterium]
MTLTRRAILGAAATTAAVATTVTFADANPPPQRPRPMGLKSMAGNAQPITAQERQARLAKVQNLMQQQKIAALLVEAGSTLEYFTGIHWWTSERVTAAIIPAKGQVIVVTPFFESPSIHEMLQVPGEIRPWQEDENPFELIAKSVGGLGAGPLAVGPNVRFFVTDAVAKASGAKRATVPGSELVRACRMVKSPAELALLQTANDITLAAIRYVHANVRSGMQTADVAKLTGEATAALGGGGFDFSLALLNEASAFPHGSKVVQTIREGSVILIDTGCTLHGYQSDITRTWVFGQPTARQREVWDMVKRGQELALETAKIGVPVGSIDKAVRAFYESKGWSKNYALPGLSDRTGHGIGMDGHEHPFLVRSDTTPLAAGMCFSDEPGIYIPGEFGIRLEDCWHMTEQGPKLFTELAKSLDQPV